MRGLNSLRPDCEHWRQRLRRRRGQRNRKAAILFGQGRLVNKQAAGQENAAAGILCNGLVKVTGDLSLQGDFKSSLSESLSSITGSLDVTAEVNETMRIRYPEDHSPFILPSANCDGADEEDCTADRAVSTSVCEDCSEHFTTFGFGVLFDGSLAISSHAAIQLNKDGVTGTFDLDVDTDGSCIIDFLGPDPWEESAKVEGSLEAIIGSGKLTLKGDLDFITDPGTDDEESDTYEDFALTLNY